MFQISTMANLETEVYELLKIFHSSRRYYNIWWRDQQLLFDSTSLSKLTILPWFPWFFNFSHGLTTRLPISRFFGKYHSEMLLFFNKNRNVILLMKMQYDAVSKRLRDGFALSAISNATKWVKAQLLPSEPCLFSSNISLNSSWIKLYQLQTASTGRISWAKTLKIIN